MTNSTTQPRPLTVNLTYLAAGLADVAIGDYPIGTVNKLKTGLFQAITADGIAIGCFPYQYQAVRAIKEAVF